MTLLSTRNSAFRHRCNRAPQLRQHIRMTTILLLTLSNSFMTFAWYGHL